VKNQIKIITLLGMGFCFGLAAVVTNYTASKTQRDPAADTATIYQITDLSSSEIRAQLAHRLKVHPTIEGKKNISLEGFSSNICKSYPNIEMEFVGEGISVAGDPPVLKVAYPCQAAQDPSAIAAASLPVSRLLLERPRNAAFQFDGFSSVLTLTNSADEWPTTWILKAVHFKNDSGTNKDVTFDRSPASVNDQPPVVLEF
jgi:hypothetical protein